MERLWKYVRRYRRRLIWGFLMLLLTNGAAMAIPQLFRVAIDALNRGDELNDLRLVALLLAVFAAAGAVFRVLSRVHVFYVGRDVEMDLRLDFYAHLTRLSASFYQMHPTGDLVSRATNDLTQVRLLLGPGLLNLVNTAVAYATAIPLMAMISAKLSLLALAVYPPALLGMRYLGRALYQRNRQVQEAMGEMSGLVQENLAGAHVVRAFAGEARHRERFEELNGAYCAAQVRLAWVRSSLFRVMMTVANIAVLAAVFFGARDALAADLTIGELVAVVEYVALLAWPTLALGWMLSLWQRGAAAMTRLNAIFAVEPEISSGPLAPAELEPSISVSGLTLLVDGRIVLDRIDLDVKPGSTLGIVGPIGSGKTMLLRSMMRLLDVPRQTVLVGGRDVTELELSTLRGAFGYVPQNHILFSKSLAENIAFGVPDVGREAIEAAATDAALAADLSVLPRGLETQVGERGVTLSGGQKQRAAIARALVVRPPILVLDDALSSVDTETEAEILASLRQARAGLTTVIVAHRVTAVQHADEIVVLERGRVVERGKHDALLEAGGRYAKTAHKQKLEEGMACRVAVAR